MSAASTVNMQSSFSANSWGFIGGGVEGGSRGVLVRVLATDLEYWQLLVLAKEMDSK